MNRTRIEWADYTWNPITGCLHGCDYCYAHGIARRFGNKNADDGCYELSNPVYDYADNGQGSPQNYPFGFNPTLHKYRLDEPQRIKKPQNVFVCSMADMFGEWVPDEWIEAVFKACEAAPQHRYLFLTKNPARYLMLEENGQLPCKRNFWYGTTTPTEDTEYVYAKWPEHRRMNTFVSIEPIMGEFTEPDALLHIPPDWTIIGAMTGAGAKKHTPKREWIDAIVKTRRRDNKPVFLKNNLADVWGEPLIQEFPWGSQ